MVLQAVFWLVFEQSMSPNSCIQMGNRKAKIK